MWKGVRIYMYTGSVMPAYSHHKTMQGNCGTVYQGN